MQWTNDHLVEMYLAVERMVRKVMSRFPREDVEDVVQEAILQVWRQGQQSKGPAWAARVGRNRAIDFIRRQDKAKEGLLPNGNAGWVPDPRPEGIDPVDCYVAFVRSMRAAPARGPKKREVVAALRRAREQKAAAEALGMSRGTLNNYVADIRRHLVEDAITEREAHAAIEFMLRYGLSEDWEELIAYLNTLRHRSEPAYFFLGEDRVREELLAQEVARRLRGLRARCDAISKSGHEEFQTLIRLSWNTPEERHSKLVALLNQREYPFDDSGVWTGSLDYQLLREESLSPTKPPPGPDPLADVYPVKDPHVPLFDLVSMFLDSAGALFE